MPPFRVNEAAQTRGSGGRGRCAPVLRVRGGMHSVRPLPREWGRVGLGVACPCTGRPGTSWPRGEGPGAMGIGGRASCTPFRVNGEGWGRVACPRVPPSRTYGVARPKGEGEGRGRCALVYSPRPRKWGRVGSRGWRALAYRGGPKEKGRAGACPSILRVRGGKGKCRGQRGREAACSRAPPFRTNGEGWAGDCVPPCRAYGAARPRGKGYRGRRARVHPSARMGKEGGVAGLACSLPRVRGGTDKREGAGLEPEPTWRGGAACLRTPSVRANRAARTRGKGRGRRGVVGKSARAPPFCVNVAARMGEKGGPGRPRGGGHCEPLICVRRGRRRSMRGKGWGEGASACPPAFPGRPLREWRGGKGGKVVLPLVEATRACHVSALAWQARFASATGSRVHTLETVGRSPLLSSTPLPSFLPSLSPAPFALKRGLPLHRAQAQKGGARKGGAHEGMPPLPFPSLPLCPRYPVRAERRRTRACRPLAFSPTPSPLAAHSHRRGAYEGTPPPSSPSLPGPSLPMKGRTTTRRPQHLPFPFGRAAPYAQEGGMRKHATRRHPSPLAAPSRYMQEGGTRGHTTLGPTFPHSRGRGVREGMPPPLPVAPDTSLPAPYARDGGTRGHATRPHPSPFTRKGVHEARPPIPIAPGPSPLGHDVPGRPVRGHATPGPTLPHSRGRGRTECMPPCTHRTGARCPRPRPPLPLVRAASFTRKGGMRGQAAPSRGAPFAREWAHEAKTCGAAGPARSPCARVHRARTPFTT
ncbi:hypothetical protein EDB85DRAFT_1897897 [Lactarius pseudohatsudake]|nr:hypothetical protein EDB85DRAFT_1897897 [Lactarius pseudohatsudake]